MKFPGIFLLLAIAHAALNSEAWTPSTTRATTTKIISSQHQDEASQLRFKTGHEDVQGSVHSIDLEQISKERPYGFFVAEKAAEFLEDPKRKHPDKKEAQKERVVVLGTGWGATAFLKNIDTELFDVTVVSPRNYFLFTPMLAGASVGSLEYRSITEPVREVRMDFFC